MDIFNFNNVNHFSHNLYNKYHLNIKCNLLYMLTNIVKTVKEAHIEDFLRSTKKKKKKKKGKIDKEFKI